MKKQLKNYVSCNVIYVLSLYCEMRHRQSSLYVSVDRGWYPGVYPCLRCVALSQVPCAPRKVSLDFMMMK